MPRSPGKFVFRRFVLGGVIIALCSAILVFLFAYRQLDDISRSLEAAPRLSVPSLASRSGGKAQTILLIGSDQRYDERRQGSKGRSDTMLLVRLDPRAPQTTVLSVPRDLRVSISTPSGQRVDKINAAYTEGGAEAVVDTLNRELDIPVNHVFEIGLDAFSAMVNSLGCAWVDVDRRYYHSNKGLPAIEQYQEINLQPGYQRLCGKDSLTYVRHRHDDSDLFRAARQQEFLRNLTAGLTPGGILSRRSQLLGIFGRYVRTDVRGNRQVMGLIRALILASRKPVRQLRWPEHDAVIDGTFYLLNSSAEIEAMRRQFLSLSESRRSAPPASGARPRRAPSSGMENGLPAGRRAARSLRAPFEVWAPTRRPRGSTYPPGSARRYLVDDPSGTPRAAYRLVMDYQSSSFGVQGVEWLNPPILESPHSDMKIRGRNLRVYWDGKKPRIVAFQRGAWSYWVSNSLDRRLSTAQMLSTAASLQPLARP